MNGSNTPKASASSLAALRQHAATVAQQEMNFSIPSEVRRWAPLCNHGVETASPLSSDICFKAFTLSPAGLMCKAANIFLPLSIQCTALASMLPSNFLDNRALSIWTTSPFFTGTHWLVKRCPHKFTATSFLDASFNQRVTLGTLVGGVSFKVTFPITSARSYPWQCSVKSPKLDFATGNKLRRTATAGWDSATATAFPVFDTSAEKPARNVECCLTSICVTCRNLSWTFSLALSWTSPWVEPLISAYNPCPFFVYQTHNGFPPCFLAGGFNFFSSRGKWDAALLPRTWHCSLWLFPVSPLANSCWRKNSAGAKQPVRQGPRRYQSRCATSSNTISDLAQSVSYLMQNCFGDRLYMTLLDMMP